MQCLQSLQSLFQYGQPGKYHGLVNQGATCYLNSVLQVLFMTEDFKSAVERHSSENPDSECIDPELDALFQDLKTKTATTNNITWKLSIDRVNEPRDAAEYFEKILHLASPAASKIFHGVLTSRTICGSCQTHTETDLSFWHLPLALVNSNEDDYSVVDGLDEHFRASNLTGDDQIYCDICCAKSDFIVDCVVKVHPDVLLLLLKRFELDYSSMTYVKNNCTVDVPLSLQIPAANQTYELYAAVEHFGGLRNGHYTATIKDGEEWYSFDDSRVTLICDKYQVDRRNAYLLFYKKQNDREVRSAASAYGAIDGLHGDAGEKRESEEAAGVAPEMEDPSMRHQPVNFLDEEKEITFSQMSVKADVYGQCADLEQSEIKQEQMEQEDGVNGGTHPPPTTSNPDLGKSLRGSMNTENPLKNKRMIAANLGSNCHQGDSEVQLSDDAIERIKKLCQGPHIKITEEEIRPLKVKKV
ncbi:uncharacterized protein si:ch211-212k18.13 isoform X1 [Takifugu flavidus]|uniref:uncharacterized protein si:ch211-212k18.13 isoform X1 n=1 Tax=Takifugu flavidus TaxID=433684 RepID=UPI0025445FED|nr:uncharacterized protein si:ch211-212k18.13 isoform X1 [Takifugu flavidus]